jgi:hypothetical protein
MLPLTLLKGLSATPSRNLGCGLLVSELLNSTLRNKCTLKKHSSFHDVNMAFTSCHPCVLQSSPKLLNTRTYCHEILNQTYIRKFKLCICVQLWEIIHVPCMKIIKFSNAMLHFMLFHIVTHYTNHLLSHTHANTTKFLNITSTLIARCMIFRNLECAICSK